MTADLQGHILQSPTGKVLEAISNTEALLGRRTIDFPRIAVFGDESTGKSSLLEAICKIPFPRGDQLTTRCPASVRIKRKAEAKWSATAWTGGTTERRGLTTVHRPEDVTSVISRLQQSLISDGSKFSSEVVSITIEADDAVDLTLVDLPGFFTHEGGTANEDRGEVDKVKKSLLQYLSDDNTIVLVVVHAIQLVKTANIFNLLKEYESSINNDPAKVARLRQRTIYCFTKCDRVEVANAPHNIEEIISNRGPFAAHPFGWYAVVNNGSNQNASSFLDRLKHDRAYEDSFFSGTSPYNYPELRKRCGIPNLVNVLSRILTNKISETLQTMLEQTYGALSKAQAELDNLQAPPEESKNLYLECRTLIDHIKQYYEQATNGKYGRLADEIEDLKLLGTLQEPIDFEKCKLGYVRYMKCMHFKENIKAARLKLEDPKYLAELQVKVDEAMGGRFDLTMPIPDVLFEEVRSCAKKWFKLAETLCTDIADSAFQCLSMLVRVKTGMYANLPARLDDYFRKMIDEQKKKAQTHLAWLYVNEIVRPDTYNDYFEKGIHALKNIPGLGENRTNNRKNYVDNLKIYLPIAEMRFIDNVTRSVTTHIFDVPLGDRMTSQAKEEPLFSFRTPQIHEEDNLEELMKIRDDLAGKRKFVESKVKHLSELRDALRSMPAPTQYGAEPTQDSSGASNQQLDEQARIDNLFPEQNGYIGSSADTTPDPLISQEGDAGMYGQYQYNTGPGAPDAETMTANTGVPGGVGPSSYAPQPYPYGYARGHSPTSSHDSYQPSRHNAAGAGAGEVGAPPNTGGRRWRRKNSNQGTGRK